MKIISVPFWFTFCCRIWRVISIIAASAMVFTGTPQYQYGKSAKAATVVQDNENESEGMQTGLKVASGKANNRIVKTVFSGKSVVRNLTLGYVSGQSVIAYETAVGKISYTLPSSLSYKEKSKIRFDKTKLSLNAGDRDKLSIAYSDIDTTGQNVKWSYDNDDVVSVDIAGNITAYKSGMVMVTAKLGDAEADCEVTVLSD